MKKRIITVIILSLSASTFILLLSLKGGSLTTGRGGFTRSFIKYPRLINAHYLSRTHLYVAGFQFPILYLGNVTAPDSLLVLDVADATMRFGNTISDEGPKRLPIAIVKPPYVFRRDASGKNIWQGKLSGPSSSNLFTDSKAHLDILPISRNSFVTRTWDSAGRELVLAKRTISGVNHFPQLLEKQIDGVFCTDGMLRYNEEAKRIFYIYYYRNKFICMDTSMNLMYKGKTVDTTRLAKIRVTKLESDNSVSLSSPQAVVNRQSQSSGRWLVINSSIQGDNEADDTFRNNAVLDFYDVMNGSYGFSLYIPRYKGASLKEFWLHNNLLFVLYHRYLVTYEVDLPGDELSFMCPGL